MKYAGSYRSEIFLACKGDFVLCLNLISFSEHTRAPSAFLRVFFKKKSSLVF